MSKFEMYRGVGIAGAFLGLLLGSIGGFVLGLFSGDEEKPSNPVAFVEQVDSTVYVKGIISSDPARSVVALSDGRISVVEASRFDANGQLFKVGGVWFREKK